jgi:hypothetical protein
MAALTCLEPIPASPLPPTFLPLPRSELSVGFNQGEARDVMTGFCLGCREQSADLMSKTAEQTIAVPEALAFLIDYRVRKAVNFCATCWRQLPKFFDTNPTQAKIIRFYLFISIDYSNPKIWSGRRDSIGNIHIREDKRVVCFYHLFQ